MTRISPRTRVVPVSSLFDELLTSSLVYDAATSLHSDWYNRMRILHEDEENPFQGYGAALVTVRDLSPGEVSVLNIPESASGTNVVYDPAFIPFSKLSRSLKEYLALPLRTVVHALVSEVFKPDARAEPVLEIIKDCIEDIESTFSEAVLILRRAIRTACINSQYFLSERTSMYHPPSHSVVGHETAKEREAYNAILLPTLVFLRKYLIETLRG